MAIAAATSTNAIPPKAREMPLATEVRRERDPDRGPEHPVGPVAPVLGDDERDQRRDRDVVDRPRQGAGEQDHHEDPEPDAGDRCERAGGRRLEDREADQEQDERRDRRAEHRVLLPVVVDEGAEPEPGERGQHQEDARHDRGRDDGPGGEERPEGQGEPDEVVRRGDEERDAQEPVERLHLALCLGYRRILAARVPSVAKLAEPAGVEVLDRLVDLVDAVHDERSVVHERLVDGAPLRNITIDSARDSTTTSSPSFLKRMNSPADTGFEPFAVTCPCSTSSAVL